MALRLSDHSLSSLGFIQPEMVRSLDDLYHLDPDGETSEVIYRLGNPRFQKRVKNYYADLVTRFSRSFQELAAQESFGPDDAHVGEKYFKTGEYHLLVSELGSSELARVLVLEADSEALRRFYTPGTAEPGAFLSADVFKAATSLDDLIQKLDAFESQAMMFPRRVQFHDRPRLGIKLCSPKEGLEEDIREAFRLAEQEIQDTEGLEELLPSNSEINRKGLYSFLVEGRDLRIESFLKCFGALTRDLEGINLREEVLRLFLRTRLIKNQVEGVEDAVAAVIEPPAES